MSEEHHIVKADEVDQTGTDISPVSDDQLMEEVAEEIRQEQAQEQASERTAVESENTPAAQNTKRPELRRDNSAAPPPPLQPPPPAPIQQNGGPPGFP
ncbi:uncharacterized protein N7483_011987 [Penicillium malachiteum]|uniref:uncharacterized protein n=1 Tax=Penicillium malachiteum TaxID=1324776 RepID=UPI002549656C|nr:uncharacterized protein N7483_011987 [Penicillium malachiteum]KAJ5714806.1 hypothetical protein N7483_011987 [Penicillium malachiteum]